MEVYGNGFLEELLSLRSSDSGEVSCVTPMEMSMNSDTFNYSPNVWAPSSIEENTILDCSGEDQIIPIPPTTSPFDGYINCWPFDHQILINNPSFFNEELYTPQLTELPAPPFQYSNKEEILSSSSSSLVFDHEVNSFHHIQCKVEPTVYNHQYSSGGGGELWQNGSFSIGSFSPEDDKKLKNKKLGGQPSKNLMAERRRRKRLNDRLSMLRSIVPKISRMDRTSILGDTIDYMKELQERIKHLQEEMELGPDQLRLMSIFNDGKPDEISVKNSPKVDVESKESSCDTRVEISCSAKPGLLLSTVTTLEALGLEIQQCVVSCFNDFAMRASCTEELRKSEALSAEDVKQALFRNGEYGGRRLH
ncbi:unnamed protein product [Cuscuta epithymum]|uniref:BHLH domain-containing protein n=1 Tax=Cuscuta epithymum TaxID=186058 RepID=A0AAV0EI53_9ASTE|nr:unnamed protein product [Cuscuta epithymum]